MRKLVLAICVVISPSSAAAQEDGGLSLMERGAQLFMEGILKEMEPALEELEDLGPMLRSFAQEMGPALGALLEQVEDWSIYEPPVILPNGDIIIRRKPEAPDIAPEEPVDI